MAQTNFLNMLKPKAKLGKSGFDLSQKQVFSSKCGVGSPCFSLECVPGDHHEINLAALSRTMSFNRPAFLRGKFRYDFFFVPYVQLWHPFEQFITQRDDVHSSLQKSHVYVPVIALSDILRLIVEIRRENALGGLNLFSDYAHESWDENALRLLDMLGYGMYYEILSLVDDYDEEKINDFIGQYSGRYVNIFRLASYQHIWYDYYRNKFYDESYETFIDRNVSIPYVKLFNFDDIDCSSFANSVIQFINEPFASEAKLRVIGLLTLHHVQWKKDIFTSALPGMQFGSVSSVDLSTTTSSDFERWTKSNGGTFGYNNNVLSARTYLGINIDGVLQGLKHDHSVDMSFDVLALKRAEALQKWKQNTLRAGNMSDDAFEAHYGVKPYYYDDNNVRFLGSYDAILQVNAVEATATTDQTINGKVADLGATGTAVPKGDTIKFDTNDFGVVLCINSFVPEAEYSATMIDKANRLHEEFDFFTPEYQNIGLEALAAVDYDFAAYVNNPNFVLGYVPRYSMYKTAIDKVHGEFANVVYKMGTSPSLGFDVYKRVKGSLLPWVSPRQESLTLATDGEFKRKKVSWYVDSAVLNDVFGVAVDSSQSTDHFIHNCYFDVKSIRPMSVLGLPEF